jgi:hypothetical protein
VEVEEIHLPWIITVIILIMPTETTFKTERKNNTVCRSERVGGRVGAAETETATGNSGIVGTIIARLIIIETEVVIIRTAASAALGVKQTRLTIGDDAITTVKEERHRRDRRHSGRRNRTKTTTRRPLTEDRE